MRHGDGLAVAWKWENPSLRALSAVAQKIGRPQPPSALPACSFGGRFRTAHPSSRTRRVHDSS
jgi:hypothetical protein